MNDILYVLTHIWDHARPLPAFITAAIYLLISTLSPRLQPKFPQGSKNEYKLRVSIYIALVVATGYVTLPSASDIKIGEFPIPKALYWVVTCTITFAVVKVLMTLLSLNLYQGILPDSLTVNDQRREQGLRREVSLSAICTNTITSAFLSEAREFLRKTRLYIKDEYQFSIEVNQAFVAQLIAELNSSEITGECTVFTSDDVEQESDKFRLYPKAVRNLAKESLREWIKSTSHNDPIIVDTIAEYEQQTVMALIPPGKFACIVVFWSDEVMPTYPVANAVLAFDSLIKSDEIWLYDDILAEYIKIFGNQEAVDRHLKSIFQSVQ